VWKPTRTGGWGQALCLVAQDSTSLHLCKPPIFSRATAPARESNDFRLHACCIFCYHAAASKQQNLLLLSVLIMASSTELLVAQKSFAFVVDHCIGFLLLISSHPSLRSLSNEACYGMPLLRSSLVLPMAVWHVRSSVPYWSHQHRWLLA
jgi:hypothetical protein